MHNAQCIPFLENHNNNTTFKEKIKLFVIKFGYFA